MSRFNTGNQIPSVSEEDFYDNSMALDEAMNSTDPTWMDRFGVEKPTIDAALKSAGFMPAGFDFVTGGTLQPGDRNKAVYNPAPNGDNNWYRWNGVFPKEIAANSQPNPKDENNWVPVLIKTGTIEREALRRTYLEVGLNLVEGSFEQGTVITSTTDVVLHEKTGKVYSGPVGEVPKGTNPLSSDFVDKSNLSLRQEVTKTSVAVGNLQLPPSLPTIGTKNKALFKPSEINDSVAWVVSRKSQGKKGWVGVSLTNAVAQQDQQNYGGNSNIRPGYSVNGKDFLVAKTIPHSKSPGVGLSTLSASQIDTLWGYLPAGNEYTSKLGTPEYSWKNRQCYNCPNVNDYILFKVTIGIAKVRLGITNGSSSSVKISFSLNGTDFVLYKTVSLKHGPSGMVGKMDVTVDVCDDLPYYIKIENLENAPCYVVGLNVGQLQENGEVDFDSAMFLQKENYAGVPNNYQGGLGANEFAAKEKSTGKFFGTYHGGHSDFLQRFRTEASSYNLENQTLPDLMLLSSCQLHSFSKITVGETIYQYTSETFFGDGVNVTTYSITILSGAPVLCERVFTHMCTTMRDFDWVHLPLTFRKDDDGDVNIGNCQFVQQFRSYDAAQLNCYFSGVDITDNSNGGCYVSFQPNYNKQYYGPALNSPGFPFTGGQFVTAKEYM